MANACFVSFLSIRQGALTQALNCLRVSHRLQTQLIDPIDTNKNTKSLAQAAGISQKIA